MATYIPQPAETSGTYNVINDYTDPDNHLHITPNGEIPISGSFIHTYNHDVGSLGEGDAPGILVYGFDDTTQIMNPLPLYNGSLECRIVGANLLPAQIKTPNGDSAMDDTLDTVRVSLISNEDNTVIESGQLHRGHIHHTVDFYPSQTAETIWDPTAGTTWVLTDYDLSFQAAGILTVFDNTDAIENRVFKYYGAANGGAVHAYSKPWQSSAADNILKYTTDTTCSGTLTVSGYEI